MPIISHRERGGTLVVTGGEKNSAGFVTDEAFSEALTATAAAEVRGAVAFPLHDGGGADDLNGESVAVCPRLQLIHLYEHRLPHPRLRN